MNMQGKRLNKFCLEHRVVITNTLFNIITGDTVLSRRCHKKSDWLVRLLVKNNFGGVSQMHLHVQTVVLATDWLLQMYVLEFGGKRKHNLMCSSAWINWRQIYIIWVCGKISNKFEILNLIEQKNTANEMWETVKAIIQETATLSNRW